MCINNIQKEMMWLKVVNWAHKKGIKIEHVSNSQIFEALKSEFRGKSYLKNNI
jgi:hypothetical protein